MNKQSNTYSIIYILILAIVTGAALAFTSMALSDRQKENENKDKMRQILAAAHINASSNEIIAAYNEHIIESYVVNSAGEKIKGDAFGINIADQSRKKDNERELPVFVCKTDEGSIKYILPVYGAGLWGPIWGYVSFNNDGTTIYGAYFAHQGETPGLGAEIEKPAFSNGFVGKRIFKDGKFLPITVVKAGTQPKAGEDYVDGVSGGTITSNGVTRMLANCLTPYEAFLKSLSDNKSH